VVALKLLLNVTSSKTYFLLATLPPPTEVTIPKPAKGMQYGEVLNKSLLFYEAQRWAYYSFERTFIAREFSV